MPPDAKEPFLLTIDDILDWPVFCSRLADSGSTLPGPGRRIMQLLPAQVSNDLLAAGPAGMIDESDKANLVAGLNEILKRPDFYQEEDFKEITLPERVKKLLTVRENLTRPNPERLNRLLLERSYPAEMKRIFEPYPGPRSFLKEQRDFFFGRSQETDALVSLITAHPVLLFYSQSGAGKTSLLNASLIPTLEEDEYFTVLGPLRVQGQIPAGSRLAKKANLYVLNALMSCCKENTNQSKLAGLTIAEFLKEREQRLNQYGEPCPTVIIFDQFEELFTSHPSRWEDREKFFEQVRDALEGNVKSGVKGDPLLRVVFSMREDYIAEMDPYASVLPEKLKTRFRLEHLRKDPALLAITEPLAGMGRSYAPTVAEKLADNLLKIPGQNSAESPKSGIYVEPLQLQIVCQSLWRALKPTETLITQKHLKKYGDVSQALFNFYEDSIRTVSKETGVTEEVVRTWFGDTLITSDGVRAPVYRRDFETGGLPNVAVDKLEEIRLIKAESRGINVRWYELAHDRFIEPIRRSNDKWLDEQSRADKSRRRLTIRAAKWSQGTGSLLEGYELTEAKRLVRHWDLPKDSPLRAFVDASRGSEQRTTVKLYGLGALVLLVLALLMAGLAYYAGVQGNRAKKAAGIAKSRLIATKAGMYLDSNPELSVLLAQKALTDFPRTEESEEVVRTGLLSLSYARGALRLQARMKKAVFSPDGKYILTSSDDGISRLWNASTKGLIAELGLRDQALFSTYSPKGNLIVTIGRDGVGRVWEGPSGRYLRDLRGYANFGSPAAFCPDEARIIAETQDNQVGVWDASTGAQLKILRGRHTARIQQIVVTPDGAHIATEAMDESAKIWDIDNARPPITLKGLSGLRPAIAFSPDGKLLATESGSKTDPDADSSEYFPVTIWNAATGIERFRLVGHRDTINSIAFSPNGKYLATASSDGSAQIWDMENKGRVVAVLRHSKAVLLVNFSSNSDFVVTASADNSANVWNLKGQSMASLRGHSGSVNSASFSADGRLVITASDDMTARIWEWQASKDQVLNAEKGSHTGGANSAAFSPKGSYIVTAGFDAKARVWETSPIRLITTLEGHSDRIVNVAISPDEKTIITSSFDNTARLWKPDPNQRVAFSRAKGQTYRVAPGNDRLTVNAVFDLHSRMWKPLTDQIVNDLFLFSPTVVFADRELAGHTDHVNKAVFSPDNKLIVTASSDGTARVWDASTGVSIKEIGGHNGKLHSVAFSPDGKFLITTGDDLSVRIWDAANYTFIKTLGQHAKPVFSAEYSPDGKLVVTSSADGIARVWNATTGERVAELKGHTDEVNSASFSPNGKLIVTSSDDQTIRVWHTGTWESITVLHGHTGKVFSAAFSPDGNSIVTASADGTCRLYPPQAFAPLDELLRLIPERVSRLLTEEERKQFFDPLNR